MNSEYNKPEEAAFAAGCFWGVEEAFSEIPGVLETEVGYAGGQTENPTYEQVCSGKTGHAETVRIKYDPEKVSYQNLLDTFWNIHDPTTLNRQGPDTGTNYRSVIFYYNENQKKLALAGKEKLEASGKFKKPPVTEIVPAGKFWRAEEYHQHYNAKHGGSVCSV